MNGDLFPIREAVSQYMARFYAGVQADTLALQEFKARGVNRCLMWAPDRMVDSVEDMLRSYQKNDNDGPVNANAKLPVMFLAMSKDYIPTGGDWGGRQLGRQLMYLTDEPDASVYGYRQAMGDVRVQVCILCAESQSARSLAAQFALFVGEIPNRRMTALHQWGQYTLEMPAMLETPDIMFSDVKAEQPNVTILVADLTLKILIPYLDAPGEGEPNDGTDHNPPGYPTVQQVDVYDHVSTVHGIAVQSGVTFEQFTPSAPPA